MSAGRETWAESYSGIKGISPCSSTHSQAVLICRAIDVGLCAGRFKYSATVVLSGRAVTWPSVICQSVAAGLGCEIDVPRPYRNCVGFGTDVKSHRMGQAALQVCNPA